MIPQRDDDLSLLTEEAHNDDKKVEKGSQHNCFSRPSAHRNDILCKADIPLEILVDHIAPFLDRRTYNSCLLLSRKARRILRASWWREASHDDSQHHYPPWPRKLVSRDYFCRVRCLEFSEDNLLLACGCSDGKIRSWDVRLGELPLPPSDQSHWPDEAVIALSYSSSNKNRLLASSSTDGSIRIWNVPSNCPERIHCDDATITTKSENTPFRDENTSFDKASKKFVAPQCILCVPSDHAVSLHFSPDDSYLVSGHLAMTNAQDLLPSSTIEIREVKTGLRLRRLVGGGIPLGFVQSPISSERPYGFQKSSWEGNNKAADEEEEHRLLATCGPNTCLKLWSWNRKRCSSSCDIEKENMLDFSSSDRFPIHEIGEPSIDVPLPDVSNSNRDGRFETIEQNATAVGAGRCIQQWFLDRFNTVSPVQPLSSTLSQPKYRERAKSKNSNSACELLVAVINEPSKDSFSVWNTSSPTDRKIFKNTSPYEIRFSPDGTKIASVDDFNTVKVWRISDGVLLKTFSGEVEDYENSNHFGNDIIRFVGAEEDLDESSVSYTDSDFGFNASEDALFPIHELVFSKDSSTVAVISRCYNEVHLFST